MRFLGLGRLGALPDPERSWLVSMSECSKMIRPVLSGVVAADPETMSVATCGRFVWRLPHFFVFDTVLRKLVGQLWLEGTVTVLDPFVWACCRLAARRLQIYTAFIFCLALSVVSIPCGFRSVPVPVGSGASGDKKEWTSVWSSCRERQAQRTKRAKAREAEGVWKEDQVRLCLPNSGFYRSNKLTSYFEIT